MLSSLAILLSTMKKRQIYIMTNNKCNIEDKLSINGSRVLMQEHRVKVGHHNQEESKQNRCKLLANTSKLHTLVKLTNKLNNKSTLSLTKCRNSSTQS